MSFPIHPDDVPSPRFGGWADDFNTYDDACRYYGCDTPEQIHAEHAWYDALEHIAVQDDIECRGGPSFDHYRSAYPIALDLDDMPF